MIPLKISSTRSFGWAVLFLTMAFALSACDSKTDENSSDPVTLNFGLSPWPPDALNYLAQEKGFFKKNDVKVKLVWVDGYEEVFKKVESGELDVWNVTLLDTVDYFKKTGVGQVILVQDYSAGADAVGSMTKINSVAELKGKKVGAEKGTVGEFFLNALLNKEGLKLEDVEIIDTASEAILLALKNGEIEAGVCYEPCPSDILAAGGNIIVDSKAEKNLIVDVYVAKKEHTDEHKEAYTRALNAITQAADYFNENPEESAIIMQEVLDMSKEDIISTFNGLRIPNFRENKAAFKKNSEFTSLYNLAKLAHKYLQEQNLAEGDLDLENMINPELIEALDR